MARNRLSTDPSSLLSSINSDFSLNDSSVQGSLGDVFDFRSHPKELKEIDLESNLEAFMKNAAKASTSSLKDLDRKCDKGDKTNSKPVNVSTKANDKLPSSSESASSISSPICEFKILQKTQEKSSLDSKEAEKGTTGKTVHSEAKLKPKEKKKTRVGVNKFVNKKTESSNSSDKNNPKCKAVNKPTKTAANKKIRLQNSEEVPSSEVLKEIPVPQKSRVSKATAENRLPKEKTEKERQKRTSSDSVQSGTTENKSISLEKSIEIAVGMEFDKLRKLIYDQTALMNKEFLKLQKTTQEQHEATKALLNIAEDLIQANTKLMLELMK